MKKEYLIAGLILIVILFTVQLSLPKKKPTECFMVEPLEEATKQCDLEIKKNQTIWNQHNIEIQKLKAKQNKLNEANSEIRKAMYNRIEQYKKTLDSREPGYSPTTKHLPTNKKKVEVVSKTGTVRHVNKDGIAQMQYKIPDTSDTATSRLRYLIETYYSYLNNDEWVSLSKQAGLKPEFTFCLGQTETGLGHQLKSRYNYFNVGNNDRGDTTAMNGLKHSFAHLKHALNNKYLGDKQTLADLNPSHKMSQIYCNTNKEASCMYVYASSKENWGNNMMNCLSNIHQKDIDMLYKFRL